MLLHDILAEAERGSVCPSSRNAENSDYPEQSLGRRSAASFGGERGRSFGGAPRVRIDDEVDREGRAPSEDQGIRKRDHSGDELLPILVRVLRSQLHGPSASLYYHYSVWYL